VEDFAVALDLEVLLGVAAHEHGRMAVLPGHAVAIALEAEMTVLVDLPRLGPGEVVGPERGDRHEAFAREPVDGPLARRGVDAHVGLVLEPVAHGAVPLGRTLVASEVGIDERAPRGIRSGARPSL